MEGKYQLSDIVPAQKRWKDIFNLLNENFDKIDQYLTDISTRVHVTHLVATSDQREFVLDEVYLTDSNSLAVYKNGVRQYLDVDYDEVNPQTFRMNDPCENGDKIDCVYNEFYLPTDTSSLEVQIFNVLSSLKKSIDGKEYGTLDEAISESVKHANDQITDLNHSLIVEVQNKAKELSSIQDKLDEILEKIDTGVIGSTINVYYFTPHVSEDGEITWTNNGNLPNPDPVKLNISINIPEGTVAIGSADNTYSHTNPDDYGVLQRTESTLADTTTAPKFGTLQPRYGGLGDVDIQALSDYYGPLQYDADLNAFRPIDGKGVLIRDEKGTRFGVLPEIYGGTGATTIEELIAKIGAGNELDYMTWDEIQEESKKAAKNPLDYRQWIGRSKLVQLKPEVSRVTPTEGYVNDYYDYEYLTSAIAEITLVGLSVDDTYQGAYDDSDYKSMTDAQLESKFSVGTEKVGFSFQLKTLLSITSLKAESSIDYDASSATDLQPIPRREALNGYYDLLPDELINVIKPIIKSDGSGISKLFIPSMTEIALNDEMEEKMEGSSQIYDESGFTYEYYAYPKTYFFNKARTNANDPYGSLTEGEQYMTRSVVTNPVDMDKQKDVLTSLVSDILDRVPSPENYDPESYHKLDDLLNVEDIIDNPDSTLDDIQERIDQLEDAYKNLNPSIEDMTWDQFFNFMIEMENKDDLFDGDSKDKLVGMTKTLTTQDYGDIELEIKSVDNGIVEFIPTSIITDSPMRSEYKNDGGYYLADTMQETFETIKKSFPEDFSNYMHLVDYRYDLPEFSGKDRVTNIISADMIVQSTAEGDIKAQEKDIWLRESEPNYPKGDFETITKVLEGSDEVFYVGQIFDIEIQGRNVPFRLVDYKVDGSDQVMKFLSTELIGRSSMRNDSSNAGGYAKSLEVQNYLYDAFRSLGEQIQPYAYPEYELEYNSSIDELGTVNYFVYLPTTEELGLVETDKTFDYCRYCWDDSDLTFNLDGEPTPYWTREADFSGESTFVSVTDAGKRTSSEVSEQLGILPCITITSRTHEWNQGVTKFLDIHKEILDTNPEALLHKEVQLGMDTYEVVDIDLESNEIQLMLKYGSKSISANDDKEARTVVLDRLADYERTLRDDPALIKGRKGYLYIPNQEDMDEWQGTSTEYSRIRKSLTDQISPTNWYGETPSIPDTLDDYDPDDFKKLVEEDIDVVDKYKDQSTHQVDFGEFGQHTFRVVGTYQDELETGGLAALSLISDDCFCSSAINSTDSNDGGILTADTINEYVQKILDSMDPEWKEIVTPVIKIYPVSSTDTSTRSDSMWLPSHSELGLETELDESPEASKPYSYYGQNPDERRKKDKSYWTRSGDFVTLTDYITVDADGLPSNSSASTQLGVAVGFCIGTPPVDLESMTWKEVNDLANEVAANPYDPKWLQYLGKEKSLLINGQRCMARVVGIGQDDLKDGKRSGLTFSPYQGMSPYQMNSSDSTVGGYAASPMDPNLETMEIDPAVNEYLQNFKVSYRTEPNKSSESFYRRFALMSLSNLVSRTNSGSMKNFVHYDEGDQYRYYADNGSLINYDASGTPTNAWTLSVANSTDFLGISSEGGIINKGAAFEYLPAARFVLGSGDFVEPTPDKVLDFSSLTWRDIELAADDAASMADNGQKQEAYDKYSKWMGLSKEAEINKLEGSTYVDAVLVGIVEETDPDDKSVGFIFEFDNGVIYIGSANTHSPFVLTVDEDDHLYAYYDDRRPVPPLEYDEDGHLYWLGNSGARTILNVKNGKFRWTRNTSA